MLVCELTLYIYYYFDTINQLVLLETHASKLFIFVCQWIFVSQKNSIQDSICIYVIVGYIATYIFLYSNISFVSRNYYAVYKNVQLFSFLSSRKFLSKLLGCYLAKTKNRTTVIQKNCSVPFITLVDQLLQFAVLIQSACMSYWCSPWPTTG